MIYTRQQFADMWDEEKPGLGNADSPLWVPEDNWSSMGGTGPVHCEWFVCIKPMRLGQERDRKIKFWDWCNHNLAGQCRCFSSNTQGNEEWWGFTERDDITLWMLKWA